MTRLFLISLVLQISLTSALSAESIGAKKELLNDIKVETRRCAVPVIRIINGVQQIVGYRSVCPSLKIISSSQAQIFVDNEWFQTRIVESIQSDGGDLDDLYVANLAGQIIARRINIPAFDSVICAMAGTTLFR